MQLKQYDVVIIGAGSGGLTAAVGFSKVDRRVLLIEKEHMGGECTNTGCIPSKALLHYAKTHGATSESKTGAFDYVRTVVTDILAKETPAVFEQMGIDVVLGEAEFISECSVKVEDTEYQYKTAVIATGSHPRLLHVPGLAESDVLTNQNLFQLKEVPDHTLIIGSGPIGMEMGQALAMLGSQVTIATIDNEFARLEDKTIRPIIRQQFEELGVRIETNAFIEKVENDTAVFNRKDGDTVTDTFSIPFDKVLVAVGRMPNLPQGLDVAGIAFNEHGVAVDTQHRTSNRYVYAVGDVAARLKFTHVADDTARQVVTRVISKGLLRINNKKAVPKVTYTEPEIAQVGLSWPEAQAKYKSEQLMRIEVPFSENDRAKTDGTTGGTLVVIARRLNGAVLGAHIIGPRAGELITPFTLAIDNKLSLWKLRRTIYAYPTYSLIIKKAGDQFFTTQIASLKSDLLNLLKRNAPKLVAGLLWIGLLVTLSRYQSSHDMNTTETALMIFDFVSMTVWGPLVYILFYTIRPITFFPATALTILAGIFFGFLWGTVLTVIAATLSASVAYAVGRFFGSGLRLEDTVLGNWIESLRSNTFEAVLTTRLIFLPFDLISYAAGILQTKFIPFVTATFLGIMLGTATFVSIGASLDIEEFKMEGFSFSILEPQFLALSALIFVTSFGLSKLLKRWQAEA